MSAIEERPDPLVAALLLIARLGGRGTTAQAIVRGLPLEAGRLGWALLGEAARNAGLAVTPIERLAEATLTPFVLPVVATRDDGQVVVLTRCNGPDVAVVDPLLTTELWLPWGTLAPLLVGPAARVQPIAYFDGRALDGAEAGPRDWFWGVVRLNAPLYGMAVFASFVINVLGALSVFYVMAIYDRVIPNRAMDTLAVLTTGVLLLYLADFAVKSVRANLLDVAARRFDVLAGSRIFAAMLGLPPGARPDTVGSLAATMGEFEGLREFFAAATLTLVGDLPFVAVLAWALAAVAGPVAWVPIAALPVMVVLGTGLSLTSRRLVRAGRRDGLDRQALLHEFASGLDGLQIHGGEAWARRRWEALLASSAETTARTRGVAHLGLHLITLAQSVAGVAVIASAALLVADGKLSTGALVACSILSSRMLAPLVAVAGLVQRFQQTRDAYRAIDRLLASAPSEQAPGTRIHLPRLAGAIACRDLSFAYPGAHGGTPVLHDVAFTLVPGEHVAILGRVGSGKTTLLDLIAGLHSPSAGHVLLDGVDNRQIARVDVQSQLGYAPQFPMLFNGTVRENLLIGHPGASDDEVRAALALAGMDDLLATTTEGLGLPVGEGGRRLSGGTRQALSLARALLAEPAILLLDEPTSMMDSFAERALIQRLAKARIGKTLVLVTHRPALLELVDRVIVLEAGRVVADGPRDEILARLQGAPPAQLQPGE